MRLRAWAVPPGDLDEALSVIGARPPAAERPPAAPAVDRRYAAILAYAARHPERILETGGLAGLESLEGLKERDPDALRRLVPGLHVSVLFNVLFSTNALKPPVLHHEGFGFEAIGTYARALTGSSNLVPHARSKRTIARSSGHRYLFTFLRPEELGRLPVGAFFLDVPSEAALGGAMSAGGSAFDPQDPVAFAELALAALPTLKEVYRAATFARANHLAYVCCVSNEDYDFE